MNLITELYLHQANRLPQSGQQIIAQYDERTIIVYQAFNPLIAEYAVKHQRFGGDHYNFNRMSWIKPNFLWMMFRCGWASKPNQERVLALWVLREKFEYILSQAVHSSYVPAIYQTEDNWKQQLAHSEVRLQWDPDHDPYGQKLTRRAIQLGLRGAILQAFATEWLVQITDITDWVLAESKKVSAHQLSGLMIPREAVYPVHDGKAAEQIGIAD